MIILSLLINFSLFRDYRVKSFIFVMISILFLSGCRNIVIFNKARDDAIAAPIRLDDKMEGGIRSRFPKTISKSNSVCISFSKGIYNSPGFSYPNPEKYEEEQNVLSTQLRQRYVDRARQIGS